MPPSASTPNDPPPWTGHWRVQRYAGASPERPTFYDATLESWDVVQATPDGWSVARHPLLEARSGLLILKDEGAADAQAERWRVEVTGDRLRVVAVTGPHEGVVGLAVRTDTDPRVEESS